MNRPKNDRGSMRKPTWASTVLWVVLLVVVGVSLSILLDAHSKLAHHLPKEWIDLIRAGVVLVVGASISRLLERRLFGLSIDKLGPQHATALRYFSRLLLFVVVSVSVLTAFGAGLPSLIFGGTFLTVVIGLAGQTIFSNIIGGLWLIFFRPFHIGNTIGVVTWQYPVLMPSFPHEAVRPIYIGRVLDINLMYTEILNQDGYPQLIPNGILTQSFIENRSNVGVRRVRMRFDMPYEIKSSIFTPRLREALTSEFPGALDTAAEVFVEDIYPTAYSVVVCVYSADKEDVVRDQVLGIAIDLGDELRDGQQKSFGES
ncbi:MAG: mechanosensitive ion channel family protein [Firmicutes bacterium]|nr:mechanosensitive ion channel family protein [Bacillota bacterium]MCL5063510.1 mechanosensitive ion channel family protein [Bacillota bacterium]